MSEKSTSTRPRQLTMASWFVIVGSVFLLLSVFDTLAGLNSVAMREEIDGLLASPTGKGLGLSVDEARIAMRVGLSIAAVCAAIAAVAGVFVLQRHHGARLALSIVAVPILLTAPLTGGLLGALVAAATLMLWSGQGRDWFAGRKVREPSVRGNRSTGRVDKPREQAPPSQNREYPSSAPKSDPSGEPVPTVAPLSTTRPSVEPQPTSGFGERPTAGVDLHPTWVPPGTDPLLSHQVDRSVVPVTVKIACVLTWVFSGVVAMLYAAMLVLLLAAPDRLVDMVVATPEWGRSNLDADLLLPVLWIGVLMFLGWTLGACVLAWFAWRRHGWARWLLAISAAATIVAGLFAFPVGLLHQLAAALTIAGLFSARARAWYDAPSSGQGPPPGQGEWDPRAQEQWAGTDVPANPTPTYPEGQSPEGQQTGGKPPVW